MGLFDSDSDEDHPLFGASSTAQSNKSSGASKGLFDAADDGGSTLTQRASATGGAGLFGDESEPDNEPPAKAAISQQQQQKPAPVQSSSGGLFGDSDDDDDDGPLMAAAAPVPKAAPAAGTKRPVVGLFGDDSDSESDATGLFGGSSKPGSGSTATIASAGLFANDAPSDYDGGLFGSTPQNVEEVTDVNAEEGAQASGQWDQSSVGRLIDMGFARVDVEAALAVKDGDVQQAADWLLVGGTAAAVERTSHSNLSSDVAAVSSANDGGLDQSSAFHGTCRQCHWSCLS